MNPFHTTPDTVHTEDYAIKKNWIDMDLTDFENDYKHDHIIDFNRFYYYMMIEGKLVMIKRKIDES